MIKPHFLIHHPIYKLTFMLYVISVLGYVLCQRKTSQTRRPLACFFFVFFRVCVSIFEVIGRCVVNRYKDLRYYILRVFRESSY